MLRETVSSNIILNMKFIDFENSEEYINSIMMYVLFPSYNKYFPKNLDPIKKKRERISIAFWI